MGRMCRQWFIIGHYYFILYLIDILTCLFSCKAPTFKPIFAMNHIIKIIGFNSEFI